MFLNEHFLLQLPVFACVSINCMVLVGDTQCSVNTSNVQHVFYEFCHSGKDNNILCISKVYTVDWSMQFCAYLWCFATTSKIVSKHLLLFCKMKGWKKRWFSLKDRKLTYFKKDHEEIASIDLTKMLELKGPEQGNYDSKCSFQIILQDGYVYSVGFIIAADWERERGREK